jgi:DNA-binding MarR family transcriptional regulator
MPDVETVARTDSGLASALRVSVARLNRRLRNTRDADAPVGIGGLSVLALLRREGEQTIGDLARAERVKPPSMTRTVACLEAEGLVTRRPHPTDGRQVMIAISDAGDALILADRRRRDAWLARCLRDLTPDERSVLRQAAPILERLSHSS